MKKRTNHIDNLLYKKLDGVGELPPAHVWSAVENALNDHEATVKSKREKKNRYAMMLLFILITGSGGLFWLLTGEEEAINVQALEIVQKNNDITGSGHVNAVLAIKRKSKTAPDENKNIQTATLTYVSKKQAPSEEPQAGHIFEVAGIERKPFTEQEIFFTDRSQPTINDAPGILTVEKEEVRAITNFATLHKSRKHRFSLTALFAPDITTRNLEQDGGSTKDEGKEEMVQTERNGALDFTFGARVDYRLDKHFSIQSGISFSTNTIDIAQKTVYARYDKAGILRYRFNMSSGYCFFKLKNIPLPQFVGDSARTEGSTSTLHYINVPLIVKYNFPVSRRIDLTVQAGIVARFIAWESISTTYDYFGFKERSISRQIEGLKKNYFNGVVGVGAEYALNKKVALTIFPSFNFATSSINKDAPVKAYPNTLSIATGVKFTF